MAVTKSYLESVELSTGTTAYIQAGHGKHVSLSFDNSEMQFMVNLTMTEAAEYHRLLGKLLKEVNHE